MLAMVFSPRFATDLRVLQSLNPLIIFSGDCLSPSLLSTVTKGKHVVDVLNKLGVHCAVFSNHEFDFGVDLLEEHTKIMTFPWFLRNVYDRFTSETLGHGVVSSILEWNGLKIGFMGLVEEDWLDTLGTVDKNNNYIDYVETADCLSAELRDKKADLVISNGVDLILGGHAHEYGVLEVNGILIVKSGSEFRYRSKSDVVKDQDGTFKYSCEKIATMKDLEESSTLRSDLLHPVGPLTMHDLLQILHINDPVLVVDATGQQLFEGLENGVRFLKHIAFFQISGIQFGFDPNRKPGPRVIAETVKILSTVLINHFESGQIVRCMKRCKSGHMMGLIKVSSSPSSLEEEVGVAVVPGVEGRILHVHPEGHSQTEKQLSQDSIATVGARGHYIKSFASLIYRLLFISLINKADWQ
uniref:Ecto-5'-nucleotidase n=1 Tax=Hucho hucho TaxID=62062 RepID=A0A4W5Q026_9TELE